MPAVKKNAPLLPSGGAHAQQQRSDFYAEYDPLSTTLGAKRLDELQSLKVSTDVYKLITDPSMGQYDAQQAAVYVWGPDIHNQKNIPDGFYSNQHFITRIDAMLNVSYASVCRRWFGEDLFRSIAAASASQQQAAMLAGNPIMMKLKDKLVKIAADAAEETKNAGGAGAEPQQVQQRADKVKEQVMAAIKASALEQAALTANTAASGMMSSFVGSAISALAPINPQTVLGFVKHESFQSLHDALLARNFKSFGKPQRLSRLASTDLQKFLQEDGPLEIRLATQKKGFFRCCCGPIDPIVDLRPYLAAYFHHSNTNARRVTNAVLSLIAVFVAPTFRRLYDVKLGFEEQKQMVRFMIEDMKKEGQDLEKQLPVEVVAFLKGTAEDHKGEIDQQNELQDLADGAKSRGAEAVGKAKDELYEKIMQELAELLGIDEKKIREKAAAAQKKAKDAGLTAENASKASSTANEVREQVQAWLGVLAYPVFAPHHPFAQEYLWRKLMLCARIREKNDEAAAKSAEAAKRATEKIEKTGNEALAQSGAGSLLDRAQEFLQKVEVPEAPEGVADDAKGMLQNIKSAVGDFAGEHLAMFGRSSGNNKGSEQEDKVTTKSWDIEVRALCKILSLQPETVEKWIARSYSLVLSTDIGIDTKQVGEAVDKYKDGAVDLAKAGATRIGGFLGGMIIGGGPSGGQGSTTTDDVKVTVK